MFFTKILKKNINFKKNLFYLFILLYSIAGVYLSLNVGITHDEFYDLTAWNNNKKIYQNYLFGNNQSINFLEAGMGYYGFGFHLLSFPIESILSFFISYNEITEYGKILILKHPSIFLFFVLSGIYFKKILFLITNNNFYSKICSILYLLYPYLLGHSFFNIKDIPFMSVWLICSYYILNIAVSFNKTKKIKFKKIIILSFLTAYLLSIRISGILIFIEYLIFFIIFFRVYNLKIKEFYKLFFKHITISILLIPLLFFLLHPNYWDNPLKAFDSIKYMSQHIQTVCTITLGTCMKAQNLPSSYLPIWFFFKMPILILFGLTIFPFTEKKIFSTKINTIVIGSFLTTVLTIVFLLIFLNTNLYDEIRQVMFLIPLIFIISLSSIYFFSKQLSFTLIIFFVVFFTFQNIKIYPYNYIWLNNLTTITKISGVFELDYWGVSTKNIAKFFNKKNLDSDNCIISNRNKAIESFVNKKNICFKPFSNLHLKNKRPFYVVLMERNTNKGLPNNCINIHNEQVRINFSRENLVMAKVFKCD